MKLLNYFIFTFIATVILYSCDTSTNDNAVEVIARDFNFN